MWICLKKQVLESSTCISCTVQFPLNILFEEVLSQGEQERKDVSPSKHKLHDLAFFPVCLLLFHLKWASPSTFWLNVTGRKKELEYITCQFEMVSWKFLKKIPPPASVFSVSEIKVQSVPKPCLATLYFSVLVSSLISACLWLQFITPPNLSRSLRALKWHLFFIASGVPSLCFCEAEQKIEKQLWFKIPN